MSFTVMVEITYYANDGFGCQPGELIQAIASFSCNLPASFEVYPHNPNLQPAKTGCPIRKQKSHHDQSIQRKEFVPRWCPYYRSLFKVRRNHPLASVARAHRQWSRYNRQSTR